MTSNSPIVPPAPVLKFPIALKPPGKAVSGTKEQSKPSPQKEESSFDTKPAAPQQDLTTIYEWAQSMQGNTQVDIRTLSWNDRLALLDGPTASLVAGDKIVGAAPLRLVLAASTTARHHFLTANEVPSVCVNHHALGNVLVELFNYLKSTSTKRHCYNLKISALAHDVNLILAAESTGLIAYIGNIRNFWWAYLKFTPVEQIGYENPRALETRHGAADGEFHHDQDTDEAFGVAVFDSWMETLPQMPNAMNEHVNHWDAQRAGKKIAAEQKREQDKKDALAEQLRIAPAV
ncbi:hypothetical protein PMIN01_01246 [Paraphaeosphaeria minitans]|uniref:Uncharacterized protein n=1 Tax=Paraphaeosphaeria minitans TaxID=565426 RepID=A0A9P6GTS5_9PLEO|nr:hypothetical protein PMIN01_01246 [Paraphaeosphaeria minitans]